MKTGPSKSKEYSIINSYREVYKFPWSLWKKTLVISVKAFILAQFQFLEIHLRKITLMYAQSIPSGAFTAVLFIFVVNMNNLNIYKDHSP